LSHCHRALWQRFPRGVRYAPTIREAWRDPLPYSNDTVLQYTPAVNTVTLLVATMLWALIASAYGMERRNCAYITEATTFETTAPDVQYRSDPSQITTMKEVVTVSRSFWLIFILAIHPISTAMAVLIKALLYNTLLETDSAWFQLLAGIKQESLEVLRGAAPSGKLRKPLRVECRGIGVCAS